MQCDDRDAGGEDEQGDPPACVNMFAQAYHGYDGRGRDRCLFRHLIHSH
eukprot:CAMPEP_0177307550 /NCGR_PEP_ID=MMETSP0368-20130122/8306_1 /TAXON_ID=447022 ORGANISM="Scrippsiella hangoei-like, Strain SHHI-4" /NCGR_SAMPLE_ID=MMETSP0368 /ASSEMBLY_ACC=CAM_ASM_000363 /LENGTH=48 /DNA_ID= /DNA_START= /DNA_END= /DNA_ORIENTATION=